MPGNIPDPGEQHPEQWRQDLSPNAMSGQNLGVQAPQPGKGARTAFDLKDLHRALDPLTDDDLKQISLVPAGSRLEQGATYVDLCHLDRGEFTATGNQEAGPDHYYVAKSQIDYQLWNALSGVTHPERLGLADDA